MHIPGLSRMGRRVQPVSISKNSKNTHVQRAYQAEAKNKTADEGQKLDQQEEQLVDEPVLMRVHGLGNAQAVVDQECEQEEQKADEADRIEVAGPCRLLVCASCGLKFHPNLGRCSPFRIGHCAVHRFTLHLDCTPTTK